MKPEKISEIIKKHWEFKFERSIQILMRSGQSENELIDKLKQIVSQYEKDIENIGSTI